MAMQKGSTSKLDVFGRAIIPSRITSEQIVEGGTTYLTAPTQFQSTFPVSVSVPDVSNQNNFICQNTKAVSVNYFKNGQPGQTIHILGDGWTIIHHRPGFIYTSTQLDFTTKLHVCYSFKLFQLSNTQLQWSQVAS